MIRVNNKNYSIAFEENLKRLAFFGKEDNILSEKQPAIFKMRFIRNGDTYVLSSNDACKVVVKSYDSNGAVLEYSDFSNDDLTVNLCVKASETDNSFAWSIDIQKNSDQLDWVEMPCFAIKDTFKRNGGNSKILFPYNEGVLIDDIDLREGTDFKYLEPDYPSEGRYAMYPGMLSTPMLAAMTELGGVYFAAHDTQHNTRHIDFCRYEDGVRFIMRLYPGICGSSYNSGFETVLCGFEGDWYDAAQLYRAWFEAEGNRDFVPIEENKRLPDWYSESPVIIGYCVRGHHDTDLMRPNNLFPYINAMPLMESFNKKLDSKVMALLMHWEGTAPWAPPYVWPPYGGEQIFTEFTDKMHRAGNYVGVYCSGIGYTLVSNVDDYSMYDAAERDNVEAAACASYRDEKPYSKVCGWQRYGYDLCPEHPFCKTTIVNEVEKMLGADIDYIQLLDQNHGGTPYFCYSKEHGHPPVPGNWESKAMKGIMNEVEKLETAKRALFGCESAASEVFIPDLLFSDNRFELNYLIGEPVPLYSYLYHRYVNNFMGNQVNADHIMNCDESKDNIFYRIAYSFTAGDFLTIIINDEGTVQWSWGQSNYSLARTPDQEAVMTFVRNLNGWRTGAAQKYLHLGDMVRPKEVYGFEAHTIAVNGRAFSVNRIMTCAYAARDGSIGQMLVNCTDEKIECGVKNASGKRLCSDASGEDVRVLNSEKIIVPPYSAVMIVG